MAIHYLSLGIDEETRDLYLVNNGTFENFKILANNLDPGVMVSILESMEGNFAPLLDFIQHRSTDAFRWDDLYDSQEDIYNLIAQMSGMRSDLDNIQDISTASQTSSFTVTNLLGGMLEVEITNQGTIYGSVVINGQLAYDTNGLIEGRTVTKYFMLTEGDVVYGINVDSMMYTPFVEDTDSRMISKIKALELTVSSLEKRVLDLNASMSAKVLSTNPADTIDIETASQGTGWVVPDNNGLGYQVTYEGLDLLLISTGTLAIDGVTKVDLGGLLGLKLGLPTGSFELMDGQVVTTSGMNTVFATKYVPKTSS